MPEPSPSAHGRKAPDWLVQFGYRLRLARGRAGLTQEALGAPDLSKSFISLLESGRSYPSVETVVALARRLDTSVASLLMDPAELRRETALNLLRLATAMDLAAQGSEAVQVTAAAEALLPDMPAGTTAVEVRTADGRRANATVKLQPGVTSEVTVWMEGAGVVRARVVDRSGQPVRYARVTEVGINRPIGRTTEDGQLQITSLGVGEHDLRFWAPGYGEATRSVNLQAGGDVNLGDVLRTTCRYRNDTDEPITFGEGTGDEMCFDFSLVYPITAFDFENEWGPPTLGRYCVGFGDSFPFP